MNKLSQYFIPHLEWETLEEKNEITHLEFLQDNYSLPPDCIITYFRDDDHKIFAQLSGTISDAKALNPKGKEIPGTFLEKEVIRGYSPDKLFKFECSGFYIDSYSSHPVMLESNILIHFTANIGVDSITKTSVYNTDPEEKIQEWFLSGCTNVFFPRSTSRRVYHSAFKIREEIDEKNEVLNPRASSSSMGSDFLKIDFDNTSFIVASVPKEFGPKWSYNLCIEYRKSFGKIPDEETRKAIAEFVGFVLGTHLLGIGYTSYDAGDNVIVQLFDDSWVINPKHSCRKSDITPTRVSGYRNSSKIEPLLNNLLPNYINLRRKLRLNSVLAKYWVSNTIYVGENLPILSSALEMLADTILTEHPEFKQYYIDYKAFNELIADELISIKKKIEEVSGCETILKKIKGAALRGSNDKVKMMFEVINLKIGKVELMTLNARNKMAHSTIDVDNEDEIKDTVKLSRAYQTLFHRTLLKILGYQGSYVDYYSIGHKERLIDEIINE